MFREVFLFLLLVFSAHTAPANGENNTDGGEYGNFGLSTSASGKFGAQRTRATVLSEPRVSTFTPATSSSVEAASSSAALSTPSSTLSSSASSTIKSSPSSTIVSSPSSTLSSSTSSTTPTSTSSTIQPTTSSSAPYNPFESFYHWINGGATSSTETSTTAPETTWQATSSLVLSSSFSSQSNEFTDGMNKVLMTSNTQTSPDAATLTTENAYNTAFSSSSLRTQGVQTNQEMTWKSASSNFVEIPISSSLGKPETVDTSSLSTSAPIASQVSATTSTFQERSSSFKVDTSSIRSSSSSLVPNAQKYSTLLADTSESTSVLTDGTTSISSESTLEADTSSELTKVNSPTQKAFISSSVSQAVPMSDTVDSDSVAPTGTVSSTQSFLHSSSENEIAYTETTSEDFQPLVSTSSAIINPKLIYSNSETSVTSSNSPIAQITSNIGDKGPSETINPALVTSSEDVFLSYTDEATSGFNTDMALLTDLSETSPLVTSTSSLLNDYPNQISESLSILGFEATYTTPVANTQNTMLESPTLSSLTDEGFEGSGTDTLISTTPQLGVTGPTSATVTAFSEELALTSAEPTATPLESDASTWSETQETQGLLISSSALSLTTKETTASYFSVISSVSSENESLAIYPTESASLPTESTSAVTFLDVSSTPQTSSLESSALLTVTLPSSSFSEFDLPVLSFPSTEVYFTEEPTTLQSSFTEYASFPSKISESAFISLPETSFSEPHTQQPFVQTTFITLSSVSATTSFTSESDIEGASWSESFVTSIIPSISSVQETVTVDSTPSSFFSFTEEHSSISLASSLPASDSASGILPQVNATETVPFATGFTSVAVYSSVLPQSQPFQAPSQVTNSPTFSATKTIPKGLPTSIIAETLSEVSSSSEPSSLAAPSAAVASGLPKAITLLSSQNLEKGYEMISIGFKSALNYPFVVNHTVAAAQIFSFLPEVLNYPFDNKLQKIVVSEILPYSASSVPYTISIAAVSFPAKHVHELNRLIHDPHSKLYLNTNTTKRVLALLIDDRIPLSNVLDDTSYSASVNSVDDSQGSIDSENTSVRGKGKIAGITIGTVAGCGLYMSLMVLLFKKYKRKGVTLPYSDTESHVGSLLELSTEKNHGGGSALFTRYPENSSSSGMGGNTRSVQVSDPVNASNSLGWSS